MRCLLLVPPALASGSQIPDVGLGYLATALRRAGHDPIIFQAERDYHMVGLEKVAREFRPELIGVKLYSRELASAARAIARLREIAPGAPVIAGGPHVSAAEPSETLATLPDLAFAVRGEAEAALPLLVDRLAGRSAAPLARIPGLLYRDQGAVRANPVDHPDDLDSLGPPAWDLIDPRWYNDRWFFWVDGYPGAPILASRGCPYRCSFCAQHVVSGKRVRRRSAASVLAEIGLLRERYGVRDIDFIDDHFLMDRDFLGELARGLIEQGSPVRWTCGGARLDRLDAEMVRLIDRAGCRVLSVGLESGSQRLLDFMHKDLDIETVRVQTRLVAENSRIKLLGMFILGFPTETRDEARRTIRFATSLPLHMVMYFTFIVMPGCKIYDHLRRTGEVSEVDWSRLGIDELNYVPPGMGRRWLKWAYRYGFMRFYGSPARLARVLWFSRRRLGPMGRKFMAKFLTRVSPEQVLTGGPTAERVLEAYRRVAR